MTHLPPDPQESPAGLAGAALRDRIVAFLTAHTTLTLATVDAEGAPAAAAVFDAHDGVQPLFFRKSGRNTAAICWPTRRSRPRSTWTARTGV